MPFPSVYNSFNRPAASDRLNNPSHSALHNTVSSALGQVEAVIGLSTSSAVGTLMYDVRSPDSNGGGHVQTANKGGTGQTSYTKGDLLVASSTSVLTKLAVSSTIGEVLTADSNTATGVKWATPAGATKIAIKTGTSSIYNSNTEQVLFAASVVGSTLGTNNGVRFHGYISNYSHQNGTFTVRTKYGANTITSMVVLAGPNEYSSMLARYEGVIVANTSVASQKGFTQFLATESRTEQNGAANIVISKYQGIAYGTSSINSSADQDLVITGQFQNANPASSILTQFFTVEKIV